VQASPVDQFVQATRLISRLFGIAAALLIGLGVLVVCEMVFVRYVLNQTTIWQTDFVTYSLVAATFLGSAYVLTLRGHVNVDVLPHYLGGRKRYALAVFSTLLALAFCVVLTVLAAQYWHEAWANNWRSDTVWRARLWIPYASMPLGLGILALQYVAELACLLTGREPPFGIRTERRS
jgi:TRAP-type C4-dicarboxylate transport system permease small subunit